MFKEMRLSEVKNKIDQSKWTPLRRAQVAAKRGFLYYGSLAQEIYNLYGDAGLKALEQQMDKAAARYVPALLREYDIHGNDARTVAAYFVIADKLVFDIDFEIVEESPRKVVLRVGGKCPLMEDPANTPGGPQICQAGLAHERRACAIVNPKLRVSAPKLMTLGDPYCDIVFELGD